MAHRYDEAIEVAALTWPESFKWRGRTYDVVRVLRRWRERGAWWDEGAEGRPSGSRTECWRVEAHDGDGRGGIYDLSRDMDSHAWRLERVWD